MILIIEWEIYLRGQLTPMKKILAAMCGLSMLCVAQAQNNTRNKELTLSAGPSFTDIRSDNVRNDRFARSRGSIFPFFNVGYTWNFSGNIGITTGAGFSRYRNVASYTGYFRGGALKKDPFDYEYYPVTAAEYTVTRTISSLDLPICLRLSSDNTERLVFFTDVGVRLNFITGDKVVKDGQLSYKALYPHPDYSNVYLLIENDPLYGFTNVHYPKMKSEGNNRFGYGIMANVGVSAALSDQSFLAVTFTAFQGIRNMAVPQQEYYQNPLQEREAVLPSKLLLYGLSATYGFRIY
jgi:hypothetical protein